MKTIRISFSSIANDIVSTYDISSEKIFLEYDGTDVVLTIGEDYDIVDLETGEKTGIDGMALDGAVAGLIVNDYHDVFNKETHIVLALDEGIKIEFV